jgi:hypothetical protein
MMDAQARRPIMEQQILVRYERGDVISGAIWMLFISLLLFWLPVFGPLIAGFVGGRKAGGLGSAILAVFLPALLLGVFLFSFATVLTGFALLGIVAGTGSFFLIAGGVGPLLVGAIIGGVLGPFVR